MGASMGRGRGGDVGKVGEDFGRYYEEAELVEDQLDVG